MENQITFKNVLDVVLENANNNFIISYHENVRNEYDKISCYKFINKIGEELKHLYPDISKNSWVGLKCDNNYLCYLILFGSLKIGWNVFLMEDNNENIESYINDINLELILDSNFIKDMYLEENISENPDFMDNWSNKVAFCSSGTTGKRQIIVYEAEAILRQIKNVQYELKRNNTLMEILNNTSESDRKIMTFLPINHILGFLLPLVLICCKCRIVFIESYTVYEIIEKLRMENALGSFGVPMIWRLLKNIISRKSSLDRNGINNVLGNNFKIAVSGGSKTDISIREAYSQMGVDFFVGYGLTELGFLSIGETNGGNMDTEGVIYKNYDFRILSSEGKILREGIGELLVNSDASYSFIMKDKKEIYPELLQDKYHMTGDVFELNEGKLIFKGRIKNIIVNESGENIYIEELEEYFYELKQKGIKYYINQFEDKIAIFIDTSSIVSNEMKVYIVDYIKKVNSKIIISKKLKLIIFTNEGINLTHKGDAIRFLKDTNDIQDKIVI